MKEELVYYKPKCIDGAVTKKIGERGVFFVKEACEKAFPSCGVIELKNGDVALPEFLDIAEVQIDNSAIVEAFAGYTKSTINTVLDDSLGEEEKEYPNVKELYIIAIMELSDLPKKAEILNRASKIGGEPPVKIEQEVDNAFAKIRRKLKKSDREKNEYISLLFWGD